MSFQLSAQAITAQTAITRMSVSRCSTLPRQRGSATAPKCPTSRSMAMLAPPPPGEKIISGRATHRRAGFHASALGSPPSRLRALQALEAVGVLYDRQPDRVPTMLRDQTVRARLGLQLEQPYLPLAGHWEADALGFT